MARGPVRVPADQLNEKVLGTGELMKPDKGKTKAPDELRRQAEKIVKARKGKAPKGVEEDTQRLFHALQVHQVELEMQNEELRRAQMEIVDSRNRYYELYDFAPVSYFTFDERGRILEVNLSGAELLGVERRVLLKKRFSEWVLPADQDIFYFHRSTVFNNGTKQTCELHLVKKDGSLLYTQLKSAAVPNAEGKTTACRTAIADITDRKRADDAMKESEKRYQTLAAISPVGIFHTSPKGDCLYVNEQWSKITGLTAGEASGRGWIRAIHPDDRARVTEEWYRSVQAKTPFQSEYRFQRPDGTTTWVLGQAASERTLSGGLLGFVGTVTDISNRKHAEEKIQEARYELERRVEERTRELADINRELNLKIKEGKTYQEKLRSLTKELLLAGERERNRIATGLHDQIGQSLSIAKMKIGLVLEADIDSETIVATKEIREILNQTIGDIRSLVFELHPPILYQIGFEEACEWLAVQFQQKYKIDIEIEPAQHQDPIREELRILLFQAVRELLMNVVKHAKTRWCKITIRRESGVIQTTVEDDGVGFAASEAGDAKGFGMFSIRERVETLGGSFSIRSGPGQGTFAVLKVPLGDG
jgi:PAS domain S-box-containing protein